MEYELKSFRRFGELVQKDANTFLQVVYVYTGIVGQKYEGFQNMDELTVEIPAKSLDQDQINNLISLECAAFVSITYPNTEEN